MLQVKSHSFTVTSDYQQKLLSYQRIEKNCTFKNQSAKSSTSNRNAEAHENWDDRGSEYRFSYPFVSALQKTFVWSWRWNSWWWNSPNNCGICERPTWLQISPKMNRLNPADRTVVWKNQNFMIHFEYIKLIKWCSPQSNNSLLSFSFEINIM